AIRSLRSNAQEIKERIDDLKAVTIGDENADSASQTESTRGSDVELMRSLGEQYEHVLQDIDRLQDIDPSVRMQVVQYGAVVITRDRHLLVAASIEEFEADGAHFLGVSTRAPLVQALSGSKVGDEMEFQGKEIAIVEIL
ncbi:MAG: hypothetical protein KDB84_09465, partial [Flavobacteriales bacterium]|nr:hypothetical protein [Flavobacteriales bacterium]